DLKRLKRDMDSGQASSGSGVLPTATAEGRNGDRDALRGAASLGRSSPKTARLMALAGSLAVVVAAIIFWGMRPLALPRITGFTQLTNDGRQKPNSVTSNGVPPSIITDGSRLYFWESGPGMSQVSASGGTSIPVSIGLQNATPFDISPTGSELLVGSVTQDLYYQLLVWIVPLPGRIAASSSRYHRPGWNLVSGWPDNPLRK